MRSRPMSIVLNTCVVIKTTENRMIKEDKGRSRDNENIWSSQAAWHLFSGQDRKKCSIRKDRCPQSVRHLLRSRHLNLRRRPSIANYSRRGDLDIAHRPGMCGVMHVLHNSQGPGAIGKLSRSRI